MNKPERSPRRAIGRLILPLGILTIAACVDGPGRLPDSSDIEPEFDHEALGYTRLEPVSVATSDSFGEPFELLYLDGYVLVSDYPAGGSAIHVLTADSLRLVASFGRKGDGPGEFRAHPGLFAARGAGAFWAYDAGQARLTFYRLEDVRNGEFKGARHVPLVLERIMYELAFLDRDRAVGLGLFASGRFALIDVAMATVRYAGDLPPSRHDAPPNVVQNAYYGRLAAHPDGSRFVLATAYGGIIEIYGADGSIVHRVNTPSPFEPDYLVDTDEGFPRLIRGAWNRGGYVDVDGTEKRHHRIVLGQGRGALPGELSAGRVSTYSTGRGIWSASFASTASCSASPFHRMAPCCSRRRSIWSRRSWATASRRSSRHRRSWPHRRHRARDAAVAQAGCPPESARGARPTAPTPTRD